MFLGIDIGSSFVKSALLDIEDNCLYGVKRKKTPNFILNNDSFVKEYDPNELFEYIKTEIDNRISTNKNIEGILLSTQMHGFILVGSDENHITNCISWQDERALNKHSSKNYSYFDVLNDLLQKDDNTLTGTTQRLNLSRYPLFHFLQNNKIKDTARFMMMGDYIASRLMGINTAIHITNAASTGMMDIKRGIWSNRVTDTIDANKVKFPEVTDEMKCVGEYRGIKIYPAIGDHQASVMGIDTIRSTNLYINISTGSQLTLISDKLAFGSYETRPFFDGKYLLTKTDALSGRNIDGLVEQIVDYEKSNFEREVCRQHVWDMICNIDDETLLNKSIPDLNLELLAQEGNVEKYLNYIGDGGFTTEGIIIGSLYNIVDNLYESSKSLISGKKIDKIVISGGLAQNVKIVRKLIELKYYIPCYVSTNKEEALLGLMMLAKNL